MLRVTQEVRDKGFDCTGVDITTGVVGLVMSPTPLPPSPAPHKEDHFLFLALCQPERRSVEETFLYIYQDGLVGWVMAFAV